MSIKKAYSGRDYKKLESYFGDEDLLDIRVVETMGDFSIKGVHKLDKYEYHVSIRSFPKID